MLRCKKTFLKAKEKDFLSPEASQDHEQEMSPGSRVTRWHCSASVSAPTAQILSDLILHHHWFSHQKKRDTSPVLGKPPHTQSELEI